MLSVCSLFAGIGGFDLAFERANCLITTQVEINDQCRRLLTKRFDYTEIRSDIREVSPADVLRNGPPDVIVGGFPCQDLSVAGARAGLAGERSGLWFEYLRLLTAVRPRFCVIENVPGLLSSDDGRDMGIILGSLGNLGYGFSYRVLDAQWFGVAQRRRRVFIVGCLGDAARAAQVLLEPESGGGNPEPREQARSITSALTANGLGGGGPDDNLAQAGHVIPALTTRAGNTQDDQQSQQLVPVPLEAYQCHGSNVGPMGTVRSGNGGLTGGVPFVPFRKSQRAHDPDDCETWEPADTANTLSLHGTTQSEVVAFHTIQEPVPNEHVSPALGMKSSGRGVAGDWGVRRLTPLECERLQGFPDGWTEGFADSTRYKMLGNAVAVPVVEWIARRLVEAAA